MNVYWEKLRVTKSQLFAIYKGVEGDASWFLTHLGRISQPWHRKEPIPNQRALDILKLFDSSRSPLSFHSYGLILKFKGSSDPYLIPESRIYYIKEKMFPFDFLTHLI